METHGRVSNSQSGHREGKPAGVREAAKARSSTARAKTAAGDLLEAIRKLLPWRGLPLIVDDKRVRWSPRMLVVTALLVCWSAADSLGDAFEAARDVIGKMYPTRRRAGQTLTGFLAALASQSGELLKRVSDCFRQRLAGICGEHWRWKGWVVLAGDGSRVACPRTVANEAKLGDSGRNNSGPQQYITALFYVASGVIWDWRRGPGNSAERKQLASMIGTLPPSTLLLMDAGFSGYVLLRRLIDGGHSFIVRVGHNVRLLTALGYDVREHDGIVYLWPKSHHKHPPLVLRLVRVRDGKNNEMCLLTNVLDERKLTDKEVVSWYRWRWGVELAFRSLKETMGKRKMLSTTPDRAEVELDWAMAGLTMLGLLAASEMPVGKRERWSPANALRVIRSAMRRAGERPRAGGVRSQLHWARIDDYRRSGPKVTRPWARKKQYERCGTPLVRTATQQEVLKAQALRDAIAAG